MGKVEKGREKGMEKGMVKGTGRIGKTIEKC